MIRHHHPNRQHLNHQQSTSRHDHDIEVSQNLPFLIDFDASKGEHVGMI